MIFPSSAAQLHVGELVGKEVGDLLGILDVGRLVGLALGDALGFAVVGDVEGWYVCPTLVG